MTFLAILLAIVALVIAVPVIMEIARKPMDPQAMTDAPGELVELSQGITHYRWIGPLRGPVAVCVHGLTTPSFVWGGVAEGLADMGYRVLVYDLYGRGYSSRPRGRQDRAFFLTQLEELLEDQEVEGDITLIGYSMGGAIVTAFASDHPDRLRQLVLLAPAGASPGPAAASGVVGLITRTPVLGDWLMLAQFPRKQREGIEAERKLPSSVPGIVDLQQRELHYRRYVAAVLSSMRGILSEEFTDDHRAVHRDGVPVLAIWGQDDEVIPLKAMGQLAEWSRSARQEVIEGAGHGLPYTHTDAVLKVFRETLRDGVG